MTNEEKRFKIKKIEKYKEDIKTNQKQVIISAVYLTLFSLVGLFYPKGGTTLNDALPIMILFAGEVVSFTEFLNNSGKKAALEGKIEEIREEINDEENNDDLDNKLSEILEENANKEISSEGVVRKW